MLNNKSILITGGTGSFGKFFVKYLINNYPKIKKLIIFSRDELKQLELSNELKKNKNYKKIRFFIGDIRDRQRLITALENVDIVIHAAALKQVDTAEYNPLEFIKTNIYGSSNIIEAALSREVKNVIALSTDKASSPINLYGATKLCSDKLFIAANNYAGSKKTKFSVVRYGNVMGSRGSVIPQFLEDANKGKINITDKSMTRFNITLRQSVDLVILAINSQQGGEIFIPKIPSYRILDLAKAVAPRAKIKFTGVRPGEKIHEEMISESESGKILEFKNLYIIKPYVNDKNNKYSKVGKFKQIKSFRYSSGNNKHFLTIEQLKQIIKNNFK
jgi:UDP-N-acetylglucosamine 4,6-dehydratase (inverting)